MLQHCSFVTLAALVVAGPVSAQSALDSARIDVLEGRAVVIGGGSDVQTIRRDGTFSAVGRSQLELSAGSRVRIGWTGTMSLDVFGPASLQWSAGRDTIAIDFETLAWADVETRRGEHTIDLPSDWRAECRRSTFHLRGIAGGPTELRHDAGAPVIVTWTGGGPNVARPPVSVYSGSSVRLDQPAGRTTEPRRDNQDLSWAVPDVEGERDTWPWRASGGGDTPADARERDRIRRQTQVFDELPGAPDGRIAEIRSTDADGMRRTRPITRGRGDGSPLGGADTRAQVPVTPNVQPRIESQPRIEPTPDAAEPREPNPIQPGTTDQFARPNETHPRFDTAQWRGLVEKQLNGSGVVAAERGTGVEVRILGAGRTKVFVAASAPAPRWCFTPQGDYLMHPGAVAVFEASGALRMSFGNVETFDAVPGRPLFSEL